MRTRGEEIKGFSLKKKKKKNYYLLSRCNVNEAAVQMKPENYSKKKRETSEIAWAILF